MSEFKRFLHDRQYRSIRLSMLLHDDRIHQTAPVTGFDRYPEVFSACRAYCLTHMKQSRMKILSFGCSTGEEVVTLKSYFPDAEIIGAEINRESLRICRRRKPERQTRYIYSSRRTIRRNGPYDLIFCMAVLQRWPQYITDHGITDISGIYPFRKFDRQLRELDAVLKPGGLLVVHYTPYRFDDTAIAGRYLPYGTCSFENERFDVNGSLLQHRYMQNSIHIKIS